MTQAGRLFFFSSIGVVVGLELFVWLLATCSSPDWTKLIEGSGGSCVEFWFNRYQSLIAGLLALGGAWITVQTMKNQSERSRADEAERRLAQYAAAIRTVEMEYRKATADDAGQTEALKRIEDLRVAANAPILVAALMDSILGPETEMLSRYLYFVVADASAKAHGSRMRYDFVWGLFMDITGDIIRRQEILASGGRISELYNYGTIDHTKYDEAFSRSVAATR
jgi:hypothetical protein